MLYVAHRINTAAQLSDVPPEYGVELDLRDRGDRLVLQHDPFKDGEDFETYLRHYRHRLMILNVKSERIEPRVLERLGDRTLVHVALADGTLLTAEDRGDTSLQPGQEVVLAIDGNAAHFFGADGTAYLAGAS